MSTNSLENRAKPPVLENVEASNVEFPLAPPELVRQRAMCGPRVERRKRRVRRKRTQTAKKERINFEGRAVPSDNWYKRKQRDKRRTREKIAKSTLGEIAKKSRSSRKFDSTLGYPGEGPKREKEHKHTAYCVCAKKEKCGRAKHYHKRRAATGAARRIKEQKTERTIRNCRLCQYTLTECEHAHDHYHPKRAETPLTGDFVMAKRRMERMMGMVSEPPSPMAAGEADVVTPPPEPRTEVTNADVGSEDGKQAERLNPERDTPETGGEVNETSSSAEVPADAPDASTQESTPVIRAPDEVGSDEEEDEEEEREEADPELYAIEDRRMFVNFSAEGIQEKPTNWLTFRNIPYYIRRALSSRRSRIKTARTNDAGLSEIVEVEHTQEESVRNFWILRKAGGPEYLHKHTRDAIAQHFMERFPHTYKGSIFVELAQRVLGDEQISKYNGATMGLDVNQNIESAIKRAMRKYAGPLAPQLMGYEECWSNTFVYLANRLYLQGLKAKGAIRNVKATQQALNPLTGPSGTSGPGGPSSACAP